ERRAERLRSEASAIPEKSRSLIELQNPAFYDQLAQEIPFDETNPKTPDGFFGPIRNKEDWFGTGEPTIAGKVYFDIYHDHLIERGGKIPESMELVDLSYKSRENVRTILGQINAARVARGLKEIPITGAVNYDLDGFHFNNKGPVEEFNLHFNSSVYSRRGPEAPEIRAYITLPLSQIGEIESHFIELATQLYDAKINFTAKADSPAGAAQRTENMVFYFNPSDQAKASKIITRFMSGRGIGEGHVLAAIPDLIEGLSWALSPNQSQVGLYEQIIGARKSGASFNSFAAAMMTPIYMERLAAVHEAKGNIEAAQTFRKEAERVRGLIQEHQTSLPKPKSPGISGKVSQARERLASAVKRPERPEREKVNYTDAYVERYSEDGEKAQIEGLEYKYPPDPRQGWQLQLNLGENSSLPPEIAEFLRENKLYAEFGNLELVDEGVLAIYIGNRNDSVKFARMLNDRFGDKIQAPTDSMKREDVPLVG
ncbi:MAG: hypothetical protein AABX59_03970, partial [Nanoarchaeota archaeon]